ncbi:MAG: hypothetical protein L0219_22025 [Phycisphaerales bacterium]|nr:hypothetical protein [Phycisphaerales bacterium]
MNPPTDDYLRDLLNFSRHPDRLCNPPSCEKIEQQDLNKSFPGATR